MFMFLTLNLLLLISEIFRLTSLTQIVELSKKFRLENIDSERIFLF